MPTLEQIKKGFKNPTEVPPHIYDKLSNAYKGVELETYRRYHRIPYQRELITEFVESDSFCLIILDACRYDVFDNNIDEYLDGELQLVWGSGRWTGDYAVRTWQKYYQLTYFASIPVVSDAHFNRIDQDFKPSKHFENLVRCWDSEWDPELGTVPANRVTDCAIQYLLDTDSPQIVVHYAQPHVPYIGDTEILPWEGGSDKNIQERLDDGTQPTIKFYEMIRKGEISNKKLQKAYEDNLRYALSEVVRLVQRINCPVIITSDHGEHLGEKGRYLHKTDSNILRRVPWFIVDDSEIGVTQIEDKYRSCQDTLDKKQYSPPDIEDRLAHLGYY